jgi:hypothetical protein
MRQFAWLTVSQFYATLGVMMEPNPQISTHPTIQKQKNKFLLLAVILFFLIFLSGMVGYLIGINTKKSGQNQLTLQPTNATPTQKPPPQIDTGNTPQPASANPVSYEQKIAACYPPKEGCSACRLIPNNSIQHVVETERRFVNLPKDVYPIKDISSQFYTVSGNATVGYISNAGLPGESFDAAPGCWSTYYEFEGNGEVDLKVKSAIKGMPDYFVRFIVAPT